MADGIVLDPGVGGDTVDADDVGGVKIPGGKIKLGANNTDDGYVCTANPLPINDAGGTISIDDGGGTITVDGTVSVTGVATAANQSTGNTSLSSIDGKITAVNTGAVVVSSSALPSGASTAAKQPALGTAGTASSDVLTIQGISSMTPLQIADNGGSLTVDGTVAATQSGTWNVGTLTTITNVVHIDDNASTISIDDGAGSITVDGTVAISGTVTVGSHAVTNAGTFVVQENGAALTALQLIDDVIFSDDAAFTPATSKVAAVGMQADETATDSVDEGDIGCPRITLDRKQIVTDYAHTAGGTSSYSFLSTAAVQAAEIKSSAGQIYGVEFFNKGAAAVYVRLYNQTGAPATTDAANIIWRGMVPGNTAAAGFAIRFTKGKACSTGIGIRVSGAIADNDATALSANEVTGNVDYK